MPTSAPHVKRPEPGATVPARQPPGIPMRWEQPQEGEICGGGGRPTKVTPGQGTIPLWETLASHPAGPCSGPPHPISFIHKLTR